MERVFADVEVLKTIGKLFQQTDVDGLDEVVRDVEMAQLSQASNITRDLLLAQQETCDNNDAVYNNHN